jgi:shikimate kinase
MRIFLIGFMGSGKSYLGQQWGRLCGLDFYDLDAEIEKQAGMPITDIFREKGEAWFREMERDLLHRFAESDDFILACGGGTPCFYDNMQWMKSQGQTIWLHPPVEILMQRLISEQEQRPLIKDIHPSALQSFIEEKLAAREPFYRQADLVLEGEPGPGDWNVLPEDPKN